MYTIGMFNPIYIYNAPSILMYKSQLISAVSILFRFAYLSAFYILVITYLIFVLAVFEHTFI